MLDEFLSYTEVGNGVLFSKPLVAICKYDGDLLYREMLREDLIRVHDDFSVPGGWIFMKDTPSDTKWNRKFVCLRGNFMFIFLSPNTEQPMAVIPLLNVDIVSPDDNAKLFEDKRVFKANDGFEFEIRSYSPSPLNSFTSIRFYTLSEQERSNWIDACIQRVKSNARVKDNEDKDFSINLLLGNAQPSDYFGQRVVISTTRLMGPPPIKANSMISRNTRNHMNNGMNNSMNNRHENENDFPLTSNSNNLNNFSPFSNPPLPSNYFSDDYSAYSNNSTSNSNNAYGTSTGNAYGNYESSNFENTFNSSGNNNINEYSSEPGMEYGSSTAYGASTGYGYGSVEEKVQIQQQEEREKDRVLGLLEQEARDREAVARELASSRQHVEASRQQEQQQPMTLAEMLRMMLHFVYEELTEDARSNNSAGSGTGNAYSTNANTGASGMPFLKGLYAENLVVTIYQYYCSDNGYMTLEQFIEYIDDSGILQTHAPRDDNDEPAAAYQLLLDPVQLITAVPRDLGFGNAYSDSSTGNATGTENKWGTSEDLLCINFAQFYQTLLRITAIVYPDLYATDSTVAFNKLLQESLCPLYAWCKGHCKRGSLDVLVLEDRIPLLAITYAPNLWRVFLMYAQDAVGKLPDINLAFPEHAQVNEKGMFGLPPGAPSKFSKDKLSQPASSYFMPEAACLRFLNDYAIIPFLIHNKAQAKAIYSAINSNSNRPTKTVVAGKLSSKDQAPTNATLLRLHSTNSKLARFREISKKPGYSSLRPPPPPPSPPKEPYPNSYSTNTAAMSMTSKPSNVHPTSGLSFTEFIEFVCRIAVDGMDKEDNFHVLYPTPFSKVIAIFTVWGVADLKKIEEVRILHCNDFL